MPLPSRIYFFGLWISSNLKIERGTDGATWANKNEPKEAQKATKHIPVITIQFCVLAQEKQWDKFCKLLFCF